MSKEQVALIRRIRFGDCHFTNVAPLTLKSVLRCIHDSADEGICHRTHEAIANELQVARKTILASVRELKALGLIETQLVVQNPLKIKINWGRVQEMGQEV